MVLHVCANALDNADGQLARLTGQGSRASRIIDSLVVRIIFLNIYIHPDSSLFDGRRIAGGLPPRSRGWYQSRIARRRARLLSSSLSLARDRTIACSIGFIRKPAED